MGEFARITAMATRPGYNQLWIDSKPWGQYHDRDIELGKKTCDEINCALRSAVEAETKALREELGNVKVELSALRSQHDALREAADVLAEATRELLMHGSAVQVGEHPETGEPIAEQFQANPQHAIDALAHYESSKSATKGGPDEITPKT